MTGSRRIRAVSAALLIMLALILGACQTGERNEGGTVEVYYAVSLIDASAGNAQVTRPVSVGLPEGADPWRCAFEAMLRTPEDDTLYSVFPDGTRLLSVSAEEGCAVLRLSREWENITGLNKTIAEYCMLKTALQFDGVTALRWETQAQAIDAVLREESFIGTPLETVSARHEIKLYFSDTEGRNLVLETRTVVVRESESAEWYRLVVDGLIAGPVTSGAAPVMPERTRLMLVSMDGRICIVNFSREFVANADGDAEQARMTLLALVNSLTELQGVSFVKIRVEGEDLDTYLNWDTSRPLERDDERLMTHDR